MEFEEKKKEAKALKVAFTKDTTEDELDVLISDAKAKKAAEEEEREILASQKKAAAEASKKKIVLKNTLLQDVDQKDYFFPQLEKVENGKKIPFNDQTAPSYFNQTCGQPVEREDLLEVFHQVFDPKKGFLFYRVRDREVYLVIVPLVYAKTVSRFNESAPGDFQKHALSFITEGSVNLESLKMKLTKVANHQASISKEPKDPLA